MNPVLRSLKDFTLKDKSERIRTLLLTEGFGFCVSLSTVFGYCLDKYDTVCGSALQVILVICTTAFITQIFTVVAISLWGIADRRISLQSKTPGAWNTERSRGNAAVHWIVCSAALVALWLIIFLAYYPSIFTYDAETQLYQVISGNYSTHHPIIHTLIMGMFMKMCYDGNGINSGMAAYSLAQMIIMALILGAAITAPWQKKRPCSMQVCIGLTAFFGIFPVYGILMVSTTKDIYFAGAVLLFTVLLFRGDCSTGGLIGVATCAFAAMLFRNNAVYAMAVMIPVLGIYALILLRKDRAGINGRNTMKLTIALLIAFALALLTLGIEKKAVNAESGSPREALSVPIQQMARVKLLHGDELEESLKADLNALIDDEWADRYDEHLADPIKERISMKQPVLFVKTWLRLGLKYPGTYLDAWLLTTEGSWYLWDRSCNRIYGEGSDTGFGYLSTDIRSMPDGFQVTPDSRLPELREMLEKVVSDNCFENVPVVRILFAPSLYFWILILFIYIRLIKKDGRSVIPVMYLCVYYLTLLLSPAVLVRYMLPYMLVSPIIITRKNDSI